MIRGRVDASGGDSTVLSLRRFLEVGYYILLEDLRRMGLSLTDAIETLKFDQDPAEKKEAVIEARNDAAVAQLTGMLQGVSFDL